MNLLKEAKIYYQKAIKEFEEAKRNNDKLRIQDACAKAWLGVIKATEALFLRKGVNKSELPKTDRGRKVFLRRYGNRELRRMFSSMRDNLHIHGYYDNLVEFDELPEYLDDVKEYIERIENFK